jgi:hypothetical protein
MYRLRSPARASGSPFAARLFGLFYIFLLAVAGGAEAGVTARFETRDLQRGTSEHGRLLAQEGHYRMDRLEGDTLMASVLLKEGKSYVIDHSKQFWSEVDAEALKQMEADLQLSAAAFDQRVAAMDPKQRSMITETIAGPPPEAASRKVEATGEQAEKSGFPATRYQITSGGTLVREIWATPWAKVPASVELKSAQSAMEAYYQRLTSIFANVKSQLLGIPVYDSPENPFADFGQIDGFAVVTRNFAEGRSLAETRLLEVKEETIPASEFELPAGYAQKAMNH